VKKTSDQILVVEDDAFVRTMLVQLLQHAGYQVMEAGDGAMGLQMVKEKLPRLAIMDVDLPKLGGLAVVETMRLRGIDIPVLMLSAHREVDDRLKGLGLGADDYMGKPFDPRELLARVAALLRRGKAIASTKPPTLRRGDLIIDFAAKHATKAGVDVPLTATEFAILAVLSREEGRLVSRERMLDLVWGYSSGSSTRTLETHIWRLRKKLGDSGDEGGLIQNRQGLGYALAAENDGTMNVDDGAAI
jgi:DNA-binding response OmpR family regulator